MVSLECEENSFSILDCFDKASNHLDISVGPPKFCDYYVEIEIQNAILKSNSLSRLRSKFGGLDLRAKAIEGSTTVLLRVPRLTLPNVYSGTEHLKFMHLNRNCGVWLGVGSHGPEFLNLKKMVHMGVVGSSGYGKTACLRSILGQLACNHDDIRLAIIDAKGGVDFNFMADAPNVICTAKSLPEYLDILTALVIEIAGRENLFRSMASQPPSSLEEYDEQRAQRADEGLPKLTKIILAIDEAHMLFQQHYQNLPELLEYIARKGRALGINLLLSTQRPSDISVSVRLQMNEWLTFFSPDPSLVWAPGTMEELFSTKRAAIIGRAVRGDLENQEVRTLQTPYFSAREILMMSKLRSEAKSEKGNIRLRVSRRLLDNGLLARLIFSGHSLESARALSDDNEELRSRSAWNFRFSLEGWHELIEDNQTAELEDERPRTKRNGNGQSRCILEFQVPRFHENAPDSSFLTEEYQQLFSASRDNLRWLQRDLSKNAGVIEAVSLSDDTSCPDEIKDLQTLVLPAKCRKQTIEFCEEADRAFNAGRRPPLLLISGNEGAGKDTLLKAIAKHLAAKLVRIDSHDLVSNESEKSSPRQIHLLSGAADLKSTLKLMPNTAVCLAFTLTSEEALLQTKENISKLGEHHYHFNLSSDEFFEDSIFRELLSNALKGLGYEFNLGIPSLTDFATARIDILPGAVNAISKRASRWAASRGVAFNRQALETVLNDCRDYTGADSDHAFEICKPRKSLSDLVLSESSLERVRLAVTKVSQTYEDGLSFENRMFRKRGCCILVSGPPGVGKSMFAEVLASETGRPLLRCDLGRLQSPFVGMTEQILRKTFKTAERIGGVLLLDECDALLRSRKDTRSEYGLKVTNQLLTLMDDQFNGVAVLTTNFLDSLDEAIARRCALNICLELPKREEMIRILRSLLEPDAPLESHLDFESLFDGIRLSGGLIKNAVQLAMLRKKHHGLAHLTWKYLRNALLDVELENQLMSGNPRRSIGIAQELT